VKRLEDYLSALKPVHPDKAERAQRRMDGQTKPRGSLGRLEELVRFVASVQDTAEPVLNRKIIFTLAGDHGIVEEGVSAYPMSVTAQMVRNFLNGGAGVNVLARHAGCEVVVVDMGVHADLRLEGLVSRKIASGTANFTRGPAMTREQAERAVVTGIELALERDFDVIGTGDMGIGNTTPSSAVASAFMDIDPGEITGRGTGVDDEGLRRKTDAIRRGMAKNNPDPKDPLDVLAKVGGFEIGGIAGLIIGAGLKNRPVVVDGYISTAGALVAVALCPPVSDYFIISHLSAEKGHDRIAAFLNKRPLIDLGMRLGEGTGAALAIGIMDGALKLYYDMATFDEAGVDKES